MRRSLSVSAAGMSAPLRQPLEHDPPDATRAIVGMSVSRTAVNVDEPGKHLDHASRADAASLIDDETLARGMVDGGKALQLLPAGTGVVREVIRLDWPRQFPAAASAMTRHAPRPGLPVR